MKKNTSGMIYILEDSSEIIGVFSSKSKAVRAIKEIDCEAEEIDDNYFKNPEDCEYIIIPYKLDKLTESFE